MACAAVGLWAVLLVCQHRWGQDIRLHYATVLAMDRNLVHPGDPMVGGSSAGPYFSPYILVLALAARAGLSVTAAFGIAALVNTALFLWGFRRFAAHLSPRPLVAALGLACTLLLWGWNSYGWSGFLDLRSVATQLPYPSMLGLALMFFVWDALLTLRARRDPRTAARLAVLAALLVLVHPFTALNTAVGAAAIVVARPKAWRRRDLVVLALAAAVALALVAAWPYSDFLALFGGSSEFNLIHRPLMRHPAGRYGLALIGLPALLLGLRRPLGRELLLLFLGGSLLVLYARQSHAYAWARALPIYGLPLQLALARHLADPASRRRPPESPNPPDTARKDPIRTWGYAGAAAIVAAVASLGALAGVLPVIPGRVDLGTRQWTIPAGVPDERWSILTRHLGPGEVVMAEPATAAIANRFGILSVAPAWPDPFIGNEATRRADSARFFARSTSPALRLALADRYRVACLIAPVPFTPAAYPTFGQVTATPGRTVLACRR